jgi:hypothetical protein
MDSARPLIVQRIKDLVPGFASVLGTANVQAVLRQGWAAPACFVFRATVDSDKSNSACLVSYKATYTILIVTKLEKDNGETEDLSENLSEDVMKALHGWRPFGKSQIEYEGGDVMTDLERNLLFWKDTYSLQQITRVPTQ